MADGYANPLVANALLLSRDGTMNASQLSHAHCPQDQAPPLDNPHHMLDWEPWVRASLVHTELMQGITFGVDASNSRTYEAKASGKLLAKLTRPTNGFFLSQLPLVQSWAELRNERMAEILTQIDNQFAFIAAVTGLNPTKHRWTMEWLSAGLQFAVAVETKFKHALACPRPVHFSPQVQPIITTPLHGTYPMGHAVQAFLVARALQQMIGWRNNDAGAQQLQRQAARISINRIVAGVHFPVDAIAGQRMGDTLGHYFLACSGFTGQKWNPNTDVPFSPEAKDEERRAEAMVMDYQLEDLSNERRETEIDSKTSVTYGVLQTLTKLARSEWAVSRGSDRIPAIDLSAEAST